MEMLARVDGDTVAVPVSQFVLNEGGQRMAQTVGTGRAVYLQAEDVLTGGEGVAITGGIRFSF